MAKELRSKVRVLPLDLTNGDSVKEYEELLKSESPEVAVLINASGYGKFGAFCDMPLDDQLGMVDLNVKSLVAMTYATLPFMKEGGRVFQIDSLSAFQPVPYIGVYGATKAFVLRLYQSGERRDQEQGHTHDGGVSRLGEDRVF